MARDKSVNTERTSMALNYYYNEAKKRGLLEKILQKGGFKEEAIKTAIARGKISIKMINSFCVSMGIDHKELTGEKELTGNIQLLCETGKKAVNEEEVIDYDKILKSIELIVETQKVRPNEQRQEVLKEIDKVLKNGNW